MDLGSFEYGQSMVELVSRRLAAQDGWTLPPGISLFRMGPDQCVVFGADLSKARRVCGRADHPTAQSACGNGALVHFRDDDVPSS